MLPPASRAAVDAIARDRERGASLLALDALDALAAGAATRGASLAELVELARALRSARPSMPVIANLVNLAMHEAVGAGRIPRNSSAPQADAFGTSASEMAARVARTAAATKARAIEARGAAAKEAASLAHGVVLTHSASETVTKALRAAARARSLSRVVVAEGRPGMEGRQVARALAAEGVEVVLVVDAALGLHAREADAAIVGADAVLSDGALVNKVGTRLLALACERAGTPLYAAADRFKIASATTLPLEEKAPGEVWPDAPPGVGVRNIYFDRTEASLVRAFATDAGLLAPADVGTLAAEHAGWAAWEARARALLR